MGEIGSSDSVLRQRVTGGSEGPKPSAAGAVPPARWTMNRKGVPHAVAHRGYKAEFPENTMGAFRGAVNVGASAIETDLHLSKDDVVVIAHDKDLKRCYGEDRPVRDCDWSYLSTLKTLREPRQPMPRLLDLLVYLAEPGNEAVWLLLDIKIDDAVGDMMARIAETLASAPPANWVGRVVLGCWTAQQLRGCREVLPDFAVAWIGITVPLAREYLKVPNVAMNMRQEVLYCKPGFIRECQEAGRPLYAWTVNKVSWMQWAIRKKLDCVITDDPKLFLEVCERYRKEEEEEQEKAGWLGWLKQADLVGSARGVLLKATLPVVLKLLLWRFGYYRRVGSPEQTRNILSHLAKG